MADILTGNEFLRMQNDAVNRVRQMQQRADSFTKPSAPSTAAAAPETHSHDVPHREPGPGLHPHVPPPRTGNANAPLPAPQEKQQGGGLLGGLLGGDGIGGILKNLFSGETDKLIVMGLILILSKEKGNQRLIMALVYILL